MRPSGVKSAIGVSLMASGLTIGCLWQIVSICSLYYSYPTAVAIETNFDVSAPKPMPAITFCANIWNRTRGRRSDQLFGDISLADIVVDIYTVFVHARDQELRQYFLSHAIETLSLRYYCFTINTLLKGKEQVVLSANRILTVRLKTKISSNNTWWLFLHQSSDMPSSYDWNAIELLGNHIYEVSYSQTTYYLLDRPYRTDCGHYYSTDRRFLSQKDCQRQCRREESDANCRHLSHEVDVYKGEKWALFADSAADEMCGKNMSIKEFCRKRCPKVDCVKHFYKPTVTSGREHPHDWLDIDFMNPPEPTSGYHHRPQMPIPELLCYLASILGLCHKRDVNCLYCETTRVGKRVADCPIYRQKY